MTETVAENTTTTQNVIVAEGEGSILADFVQGDYKLSMWIPGDSGKTLTFEMVQLVVIHIFYCLS